MPSNRTIYGPPGMILGRFSGCVRAAFASAGPRLPRCRHSPGPEARGSGGLDREWAGCRQRRDQDGSAPGCTGWPGSPLQRPTGVRSVQLRLPAERQQGPGGQEQRAANAERTDGPIEARTGPGRDCRDHDHRDSPVTATYPPSRKRRRYRLPLPGQGCPSGAAGKGKSNDARRSGAAQIRRCPSWCRWWVMYPELLRGTSRVRGRRGDEESAFDCDDRVC